MVDSLKIVRAAIRDDRGAVWSVPIPGRHHNIIANMRDAGYEGPLHGDHQGFLLNDGRFARRKPALYVAEKAGQLIGGKTISSTLTSEDLW